MIDCDVRRLYFTMSRADPDFMIRDSTDADYFNRLELSLLAWERAYRHIFTPEEFAALRAGELSQSGSWVKHRRQRVGTWIAAIQDRIIGYVGASTAEYDRREVGEITHLYVHPDNHGQGVGRALWDYGVMKLRKYGCDEIWVWTLEKAPAVAFYERQGCVRKDRGVYQLGDHGEPTIGLVLQTNDRSAYDDDDVD
jgi:GNAT superfamily N-acetyltransferase